MDQCEHIYPQLGQPQICARCGYVRPQAEVDALMEAAGISPPAPEPAANPATQEPATIVE